MKKYIDCDGVILDTESHLFDEYKKKKEKNPELTTIQYLQEMDWRFWLEQAQVLQDAISILRSYDYQDTDILTKVHSLQEAREKIIYFRSRGIKNNIVIVPNEAAKSQIVCAQDAILVDDNQDNLWNWRESKGHAFYFGEGETIFPRVFSLEEVMNPKKVKKLLKSNYKKW